MKPMEDQINNLSLAFTRFMKEPMFSSNTNSRSQRTHDDSDTENEQSDDESSNNVDVPTDYQLSDTLLVLNFPSNFQVNIAPFGTPEVKNNDTDLLIVEKRINDSLKPLFLMSSILSSDSFNVDVELISYFAQSAIVLAVNTQASLSRVRRNNITKEIYGSEVLLPIKINDTSKMIQQPFSEEQEVNLPVGGRLFHHKQVWKELGLPNFCQEVVNGLKFHLLPNFKPMPNPIPISIPDGLKSDCITKEVQDLLLDDAIEQFWGLFNFPISCNVRNFCTLNFLNPVNITLVVFMDYLSHLLKNRFQYPFCTGSPSTSKVQADANPIPISIPGSPKSDCITKEEQDLFLDDAIEQVIYLHQLCISPEQSNEQLLNNQNECTPPRSKSMEAMFGLPITHSFAFYPIEIIILKTWTHHLHRVIDAFWLVTLDDDL
ncbi:hypothetical protein ACTFIR_003897 [Dictyostelium discoideum]